MSLLKQKCGQNTKINKAMDYEKEVNLNKVLTAKNLFIIAVLAWVISYLDIGGFLNIVSIFIARICFFLSVIALIREQNKQVKEGTRKTVNWKLSLTLILITIVAVVILGVVAK